MSETVEKDARRLGVTIGRLRLYLWAGSWSWVERLDCGGHCWNVYVGPFGVEWERPS